MKEDNGVCHWIPFYEPEVNSPSSFSSRFMADFLNGKVKRGKPVETTGDIFEQQEINEANNTAPIEALSYEARNVLTVGREIWRYYMSQPGVSANASFLDIRAYFQGFKETDKGKLQMNSTSTDQKYMELWGELKSRLKMLEAHIEPKIYEHGFLLK